MLFVYSLYHEYVLTMLAPPHPLPPESEMLQLHLHPHIPLLLSHAHPSRSRSLLLHPRSQQPSHDLLPSVSTAPRSPITVRFCPRCRRAYRVLSGLVQHVEMTPRCESLEKVKCLGKMERFIGEEEYSFGGCDMGRHLCSVKRGRVGCLAA